MALDRDLVALRPGACQWRRGHSGRRASTALAPTDRIDLVTAVKFAHHLEGAALSRMLAEMARVAATTRRHSRHPPTLAGLLGLRRLEPRRNPQPAGEIRRTRLRPARLHRPRAGPASPLPLTGFPLDRPPLHSLPARPGRPAQFALILPARLIRLHLIQNSSWPVWMTLCRIGKSETSADVRQAILQVQGLRTLRIG